MNSCAAVVLVGVVFSATLATAQAPPKIHRVGILHGRSAGDANVDAFRTGLQRLGYREGESIKFEYRWADGKPERFPELAAQLVQLRVDVIFTASTPGALAAKNATATIPIVFVTVGNPVEAGVVANLARPGGNISGLTHISVDLAEKTLGLLKEAVPTIARVTVLAPSMNPTTILKLRRMEAAAGPLGVRIQVIEVRRPDDLPVALSQIRQERPDALVALLDTIISARRRQIVEFAATTRLPAIYEVAEFVNAGGLMSYGTSFPEIYSRAAGYVDKILKGARVGDLPIEQPTKFELIINLKTAKTLGLTIPPSLLLRADQVIE